MMAWRWTTVSIVVLLAVGCAGEDRPAAAPSRAQYARSGTRAPPASTMSRAEYVARAASIDLFIIGSSELALQRSSNARIREFAAMMIQAHKGTSAQLSLEG